MPGTPGGEKVHGRRTPQKLCHTRDEPRTISPVATRSTCLVTQELGDTRAETLIAQPPDPHRSTGARRRAPVVRGTRDGRRFGRLVEGPSRARTPS